MAARIVPVGYATPYPLTLANGVTYKAFLVGTGRWGTVFQLGDRPGVIAKVYNEKRPEPFAAELLFLKQVRGCRNVVQLYVPELEEALPMQTASGQNVLFLKQAPGRSVAEWLVTKDPPLSHKDIAIVVKGVLEALQSLSRLPNPICHLDLKPENVMYDRETCKVTLVDLGNADYRETLEQAMRTPSAEKKIEFLNGLQTPAYRDPLVMLGIFQNPDMFGLGCLLASMLAQRELTLIPFRPEAAKTINEWQIAICSAILGCNPDESVRTQLVDDFQVIRFHRFFRRAENASFVPAFRLPAELALRASIPKSDLYDLARRMLALSVGRITPGAALSHRALAHVSSLPRPSRDERFELSAAQFQLPLPRAPKQTAVESADTDVPCHCTVM